MIIGIAAILGVYCVLLVLLIAGWNKAITAPQLQGTHEVFISVIVPVRNEEKNISRLLSDLGRLQYSKFEVIVVDDHSSDNTLQLVKQAELHNLILLKSSGIGKKHAISSGVTLAKGVIIVTTDADCSIQPEWLSTINHTFSDDKIIMAFGGVAMRANDFFSSIQSIEFASLIATAASTMSLGYPTMCNAANMAFRKTAFEKVKGYEGNDHIASGDDEFLLRKINAEFPGTLGFFARPASVVSTQPQHSLKSFFHQRLRWAGKWKFNTSISSLLLAFFIISVQVSVLLSWSLIGSSFILLLLLVIKAVVEAYLLIRVCNFLCVRWNWISFLILQFIYPMYVLSVGLLSNFTSYTWKERRLS